VTIEKKNIFCLLALRPDASHCLLIHRFLDYTQRRTTFGKDPLDEWSARRRYHYLKTHNTHNRETSVPAVGLEPRISADERPQTYALDRAATGTGQKPTYWKKNCVPLCLLQFPHIVCYTSAYTP